MHNAPLVEIVSDAGFSVECVWSGPFPQGMGSDEGGSIRFQKGDFSVSGFAFRQQPDGSATLRLECRHRQSAIHVRVEYMLDTGAFYFRRRILLSDTSGCGHFIQTIAPLDAALLGKWKILKSGGLGQPAVLQSLDGGAFFGLEYPAASVSVTVSPHGSTVQCIQECGERLRGLWLESDWTVPAGITMTVAPGAILMGPLNVELKVQGHLDALGTATQPIT
ncbi:MAG: hypothetical protein QHI48_06520, partial [Bacteroidota bacterium]|nr:hypothetical protein [Bacteroidota bacterium]